MPALSLAPVRRLDDDELKRASLLYIEERLTLAEIATLLSCTPAMVSRQLKSLGVEIRTKKDGPLPTAGTKIDLAEAKRLYFEELMSFSEAGAKVGCSGERLSQLFRAHGLAARSKAIARKVALRAGKFTGMQARDWNEAFFDVWSPAMAWVLGLIWSDGCLTDSGSSKEVVLAMTDEDTVRKSAALLEYTGKIHVRHANGQSNRPMYSWGISGEAIATPLVQLGLAPRKSTSKPLPAIPEEYFSHFVRGYLDGNGWFSYSADGSCRAVFVSTGSRPFVESLVARLFMLGFGHVKGSFRPATVRHTVRTLASLGYPDRKAEGFSASWHGETARDLHKWLYEGAPESIRMERKAHAAQR